MVSVMWKAVPRGSGTHSPLSRKPSMVIVIYTARSLYPRGLKELPFLLDFLEKG